MVLSETMLLSQSHCTFVFLGILKSINVYLYFLKSENEGDFFAFLLNISALMWLEGSETQFSQHTRMHLLGGLPAGCFHILMCK